MAATQSGQMLAQHNHAGRAERARVVRSVLGAALLLLTLAAAVVVPPNRVLAAGVALQSTGTAGSTDSTLTTPTTEATKSVTPTPTGTFGRLAGTKLRIHFPAPPAKLIAVGFHQASNRKALRFIAGMKCLKIDRASKTRALLKKDKKLKLFQQPLRGRGSSNFSAADCAVPPKTVVLSPVTGVVTSVKSYRLYGYIHDRRLEIKPDGWRHLRVVMIHITGVKVKKGQRVVGGVTPVATVRHLPFVSTINRFVPAKKVEHVHIQVNRDTFKGSF